MLNDRELALIGGGNMGEAILKGLIAAQLISPQRVTVTDVIEPRVAYLRDTYAVRALTDNAKAVSQADLIILAVKPQDIVQTIQGIASAMHDQQVVISIAAGITWSYCGKCRVLLGATASIPILRNQTSHSDHGLPSRVVSKSSRT